MSRPRICISSLTPQGFRFVPVVFRTPRAEPRAGRSAFSPCSRADLCPQPFDAVGSLEYIPRFERLHFLELVLDPTSRWTSHSWRAETDPIVGIKQHAITVLRRICGHTKVFKMITIGVNSTWERIKEVETEVLEVP